MEPALQMTLVYLLIILVASRQSVTMAGVIGLNKRNSEEGSAGGNQYGGHHHRRHHTSDASEIERLHGELHSVSRELAQTKMALASLEKQVSDKLNALNSYNTPLNMQMSCRTTFTLWHETVGKSLEYLDNFDVHCRHNEFLRQWRMTWGERGKKKAMKFVCCKFLPPGSKSNAAIHWGH